MSTNTKPDSKKPEKQKLHLVVHTRIHADEFTAILIALIARNAEANYQIHILNDMSFDNLLPFARKDTLFFGIGGEFAHLPEFKGKVFDEHYDRSKGGCCADLVYNHFLLTNPELINIKGFLDEVSQLDLSPTAKEHQLSSLMKVRFRVTKDQRAVARWALKAFKAIASILIERPEELYNGLLADSFSRQVENCFETFRPEKSLKSIEKVRTWFGVDSQTQCWTGVLVAYTALFLVRSESDAKRWLAELIMDTIEDAVQYQKAFDAFKTYKPHWCVGLRVAQLDSENYHFTKVFRSFGVDMLVLRNSRRQIGIFTNIKSPNKPDIAVIIQMLRWLENKKRNRPMKLSEWDELSCVDTSLLCPEWYNLHNNSILNGSESHPCISPTVLTLEDIWDILVASQSVGALSEWKKIHNAVLPKAM